MAVAVSLGHLHAKRPELDSIYWGTLRHRTGQLLVPTFTGQIIVLARLSGTVIAQSPVAPGQNAYTLKVPLDDGFEPRLAGTARFGERVRLYLRNTVANLEYEVLETRAGAGLSVATVKGALLAQNLSVSEDLSGGDALMDYAAWKLGYSGPGGLDVGVDDRALDRDGDGRTNFQEYLAGTDPLDANDRLAIRAVVRRNGVTSVQFGPVRLRHMYSLFAGSSLENPDSWSCVGTFNPTAGADAQWLDHAAPDAAKIYYRVQVELH